MKYNVFIGLFVVALSGCSIYSASVDPSLNTTYSGETQNGRVVVAVTDAAASMGQISAVEMEIRSIELYSNQHGWVNLNTENTKFDLLELKSKQKLELFAEETVNAGMYERMRFEIGDVYITDDNGTHRSRLAQDTFEVSHATIVDSQQTTAITIDVLADKSIHQTENGDYFFATATEIETRENAQVDVMNDMRVVVSGGNSKKQVYSVNHEGNVVTNIAIEPFSVVQVSSSGVVSVIGNAALNTTLGIFS